jgi:hypothetical protein
LQCRESSIVFRQPPNQRIAALIGEDGVKRSIDEAYEEYGRQQNSEVWRVFLHGTEEERRQFRAKCDAEEGARAREHEDQFYASLLKSLAGEPPDIEPGTGWIAWKIDIAKALIVENPMLAAPEYKDTLLRLMEERFSSGHTVHFDKSDVAVVKSARPTSKPMGGLRRSEEPSLI